MLRIAQRPAPSAQHSGPDGDGYGFLWKCTSTSLRCIAKFVRETVTARLKTSNPTKCQKMFYRSKSRLPRRQRLSDQQIATWKMAIIKLGVVRNSDSAVESSSSSATPFESYLSYCQCGRHQGKRRSFLTCSTSRSCGGNQRREDPLSILTEVE